MFDTLTKFNETLYSISIHFYHIYLLLSGKLQLFLQFLNGIKEMTNCSLLTQQQPMYFKVTSCLTFQWPIIYKQLLKDDRPINFTIRASQYSPNSCMYSFSTLGSRNVLLVNLFFDLGYSNAINTFCKYSYPQPNIILHSIKTLIRNAFCNKFYFKDFVWPINIL